MECTEQKWLSTDEYLEKFITAARQQRVPLSGSLEVTSRCNLKCMHCYLDPENKRYNSGGLEMRTERVLEVIDEVTDAGCLYLLITGGEPLLRSDFPEIYLHAKERGLLVTVFSNGTLVTDRIIGMFRELPPHEIEISLYGATAPTHERITGVSGSFDKCVRGVRLLVENNIRVNLKTILMTLNSHELSAMEEIAKGFGSRFRFDAAISPRLSGDKAPLELRVSPEEAVEREFSSPARVRQWEKLLGESEGHVLTGELYGCGAGVTGFHISRSGHLHPCIMVLDICYNLSEISFRAGWEDMISRLRSKKAGPDFPCRGCEKINLCGYCPAFFRLENGADDIRSEYICRMGELRHQQITDYHLGGEYYDS